MTLSVLIVIVTTTILQPVFQDIPGEMVLVNDGTQPSLAIIIIRLDLSIDSFWHTLKTFLFE